MTARDVLLDLIKCNFDGAGWYGGNLLNALRKTDYELAGKRVGSLKTIYQQAHHAAYWKYVVIRRITGDRKMKFPYAGANWPKEHAPRTERQWTELIAHLRELHRLLAELVQAMPDSRLDDAQILRLLHGIASHDVYHNAQIRHVKALLKAKSRQG